MCVRWFSYKKVPRPEDFRIVSRKELDVLPLGEQLATRICLGGPISVADYMNAVLAHPKSGYYMQGDVFGAKGDFITSPEISQIFGEMIGVWIAHELHKIGTPRPMQLVELGPGRGTLMADILRTLSQLPDGKSNTGVSIHLVEISERLAAIQAQTLTCKDIVAGSLNKSDYYQQSATDSGIPIFWYRTLDQVPKEFSVFLAHEFFDALPVHKFQRIDNHWKELLVKAKSNNPNENLELEFVLSKSPSNHPATLLISQTDKRQHVEVSPQAAKIAADLAGRLEEDGGIGLIVDYGHLGEKEDTFRAFKNHALHDPLESPGTADLTADVDFSLLIRAAEKRSLIFGPVKQRDFLLQLGIATRLNNLIKQQKDPNVIENLKSGVSKILNEMNTFYVMALFPQVLKDHLTKFPVAGFN